MQLGPIIKYCRSLKGLTLGAIASTSSLSVSYLSLVEKGKREPSLSSVKAISEALNIPFYVLIFLASSSADINEITPSAIQKLTDSLNELLAPENVS